MLSSWPRLRAQLARSTETLLFHHRIQALRRTDLLLERFPDTPALLDALHGPDGDPASRNALLAALVRRAKTSAEPATTLLLLALWPGLDAVHRRLSRHFRAEPEVLVSEITGRVVAGIQCLDLDRVNRIAATLIRNVERDIIRARKRSGAEARCRADINDVDEAEAAPWGGTFDPDAAVGRLVRQLRPLIGADALLVISIAVLGEKQQDAAAAIGLNHEAGRKRYQRALKRLRVSFEEIC